ncbi:serine protease inhibitor [Desulfosporosinus orientis DSM 765]|uniref:Serine protease inhibitor n=1 Tax=Desulfosporosinus orientis (strain ATCC 19365 / DSM 765 / NCIMB 8382 / VKM B-1628 / Singapore I) TaxID=768706 RepID=G7W8T9_DESOD|nr:serpin family protein [Desulfosporosinus orientis]AET67799.1 serine protease inhibitor [Desulfosporosinus orientis DSM 765]
MKKRFSFLLCIALTLGLLAGCSVQPSQTVQSDQNSIVQNNDIEKNDTENVNQNTIQNNSVESTKISQDVINANNRFAFNIFKQLDKEDGKQNIFISPFSISTALTMTYQGAAASTKEAMAKTLGYIGIDEAKLNDSYKNLIPYLNRLDAKVQLNISNSLWVREGENIKQDFLQANRDFFNDSVRSLDFNQENAPDQINQWISEATNKKIDKMISSPIPSDVIMYLINAIYFKGDWAKQFDPHNTFKTQFEAGNGNTDQVMMMKRTGTVEYGQGNGFQAVRLPYGSGKMAMYCILPEKDVSINDFIATLDPDRWQAIQDSIAKRDEVHLQLPRFKLEYGIKNLTGSLTALGMGEAFTGKADFSGIGANIFISRVLHKAIIEVNEEGSEAAASTVVEMKQALMANPLTFSADRPFVFIIADDETGTILFMGKLYGIK